MAEYVIVLDPGHGSEQYHGGEFGPYIEKDIDLAVATAMKNHLEQFEGVKVYMTRYDDREVGLKERCDIAKAYNADYFISVHFNTSATHELYGSEVWLPIQNKYYNQMYPIANELMNNFKSMGLFDRGIKTRLSSSGKDNYYAVIKNATDYGIPSCIIEHCHLDNINDTKTLNITNAASYAASLNYYGIQDAEAIAKALHLKSSILGEDYTNYKTVKGTAKASIIKPDMSAPEVNKVELISTDAANSAVTLKLTAKDSNSYILYYKYSLDGGVTFSECFAWPTVNEANHKSTTETVITVKVPNNQPLNIVTMVYNSFDVTTLSNVLTIPALSSFYHTDNVYTLSEEKVDNDIFYANCESSLTYGVVKNDILNNNISFIFEGMITAFVIGFLLLSYCVKKLLLKKDR